MYRYLVFNADLLRNNLDEILDEKIPLLMFADDVVDFDTDNYIDALSFKLENSYNAKFSVGYLEIGNSLIYKVILDYLNKEFNNGNTTKYLLIDEMFKEHMYCLHWEGMRSERPKSKIQELVLEHLKELIQDFYVCVEPPIV